MGLVAWLLPASFFREITILLDGLRYITSFLNIRARCTKKCIRSGSFISVEDVVPILLQFQRRNSFIGN